MRGRGGGLGYVGPSNLVDFREGIEVSVTVEERSQMVTIGINYAVDQL